MTTLPPPTARKLGLVIDLDICVGCHACAVACKEWNDGGSFGPLPDSDPYGAEPDGVWFNRIHSYEVQGFGIGDSGIAGKPRVGKRESGIEKAGAAHKSPCASSIPHSPLPIPVATQTVHFPRSCLHCETPACVTVCPTGASYKRAEDGIVLVDEDKCIGCQLCAWACPYGAREFSAKRGVMQKCTLCVDRIYNETLEPADRQPACVKACPTRARHFGDLGDENSNVSKLVAERGGYALMPELGYQPVNRYLPPRPRRDASQPKPTSHPEPPDEMPMPPLLRWIDRVLSR
ncbi:MAG: 4Fe-4S dicluster domain-containing protein [Dokdonella sp.]|jgi:Fe-S-cluster-containing dehydrogenase component|uniref:4Fe-4S dicluster domain-containing protein n=1 Tax=Dokdonella sp. TaxID=2291710 RepID=UPI002C937901|nr:4Fe-4S dicluster domain-containing protein [Dokdonella sp.]HNV08010.1 4Fe-4S dicluster domain-containing protein [Dokdonella sp.]HPW05329.1 4Fe-4S dicluster domain-containing protein [Dokdonella sp.]